MSLTSQIFESFVPVYDTVPETWEDGRNFLVEHLKKVSNSVNVKEIGFFLEEELLSGKQFVPSPTQTPLQFRAVFRFVADVSPLVAGVNTFPMPVTFNNRFTLVQSWVAATNSGTLNAVTLSSEVTFTAANITINSPGNFDRAWCVIEYLKEV